MREADAIRSIKGIGEKTEKLFAKLGIRSVGDLLRYYPRDYEEYAQPESIAMLKPGKKAAVAGRIAGKVGVREYRKAHSGDGCSERGGKKPDPDLV